MTQYSVRSTQYRPLSRAPLHHWHAGHGARFVEKDGWNIPSVYTTVEEEVAAARTCVGLTDISSFAKISLHGQGVSGVCQFLLGDTPASRARGAALFDAGGPGLACRLVEDHLLLLASTTNRDAIDNRLANLQHENTVTKHDVTSAYAGFHIVGPKADEVIRRLTALDISSCDLPLGSCAETALASVHALLVRVPDMSLPAIRIYVASDLGEYVWERLFDAGRRCGIVPVGLEAWRQSFEP